MTGAAVEALLTDRLELPAVTAAIAHALLDSRPDSLPDGLRTAAGWPTTDTLDGIRMSWQAAGRHRADSPAPPDPPDPEPSGGSRLVVLRDTREVIGDLGWKGGPGPDGVVEIGYGLAAPSRGQGYGTEAVGAFANWALGPGGATTLTAEVLADNTASRRLLERIGFTLDHVAGGAVWYARSRPGAAPTT